MKTGHDQLTKVQDGKLRKRLNVKRTFLSYLIILWPRWDESHDTAVANGPSIPAWGKWMNTEHWWHSDRKVLAVPLTQSQIVSGLRSNQVLLQLQCETYFSIADGGTTLWKVNNPPTRLPACDNPEHLQTSIVKTSNLASETNHYIRMRTAHTSIPIPIARHRSLIIWQYLRALLQARQSWHRSR